MSKSTDQTTPARGDLIPRNAVLLTPPPKDLSKYQPTAMSMTREYWKPSSPGESKVLVYCGLQEIDTPDFNDKTVTKPLMHAVFTEDRDGVRVVVVNASKIVVGTMEEFSPPPGTVFQITFLGKRQSTNSYNAWNIVPMEIPE